MWVGLCHRYLGGSREGAKLVQTCSYAGTKCRRVKKSRNLQIRADCVCRSKSVAGRETAFVEFLLYAFVSMAGFNFKMLILHLHMRK